MNKFKNKSLLIAVMIIVIVGVISIVGLGKAQSKSEVVELTELAVALKNADAFMAGLDFLAGSFSGMLGGSGTRFPNGLSADTTSPIPGQVRGTTFLATGDINGRKSATTTDGVDFSLTAAESGHIVFIKGTGATTTLPAVTNTGAIYTVSVKAAFDTNDWVVQSAEGDNINGSLFVNDAVVACSAEDRIKFVADGEEIGDFVVLISDGTNWNILNSRGEGSAKMLCTDPS